MATAGNLRAAARAAGGIAGAIRQGANRGRSGRTLIIGALGAAAMLLALATAPALADPAETTTSLKSTPNPSELGETVRFEATVTAFGGGVPTGTVSFFDDGDPLGDAAVATVGVGQSIAAGTGFACALTSAGGVRCWGNNSGGQLGDGSTTQRTTPVDVVGLGSGVVAIAGGGNHSCALTGAGGVQCWGGNDFGQLGNGTTTPWNEPITIPVDVSGLGSGVVAIAAGSFHSCALTVGGESNAGDTTGAGNLATERKQTGICPSASTASPAVSSPSPRATPTPVR